MGFGDKFKQLTGSGEPAYLKVIDGVSKVLSIGKKPADDGGAYNYGDESASDKETFLRFLTEYVKELRKGD